MTKLNDRQTAILVNAANRANGHLMPLPEGMQVKGVGLNAVLRALERRGLVQRSAGNEWIVTDTGRAAVTEIGAPSVSSAEDAAQPTSACSDEACLEVRADTETEQPQALFRPGTRQAQLLEILRRDNGTDIDEMVQLTGWQPHSVRAVLTGFRKRGIEVTRTKEGNGVSVYRATLFAAADRATR